MHNLTLNGTIVSVHLYRVFLTHIHTNYKISTFPVIYSAHGAMPCEVKMSDRYHTVKLFLLHLAEFAIIIKCVVFDAT